MKEESFLKSYSLSKISNRCLCIDPQGSTILNSCTCEIDELRALIPLCHDPKSQVVMTSMFPTNR